MKKCFFCGKEAVGEVKNFVGVKANACSLHYEVLGSRWFKVPAQQSVHLTKSRWVILLDKLSAAFRR